MDFINTSLNPRELRCAILQAHYDLSKGNTMLPVMRADVADALDFPDYNSEKLLSEIYFLEKKHLLQSLTNMEDLITVDGIDEVENGFPSLSPKINIDSLAPSIVIHGNNNGVVGQASRDVKIETTAKDPDRQPFVDLFYGGFSHESGSFGRRIASQLCNMGDVPALNIRTRVEAEDGSCEDLIPDTVIPPIAAGDKTSNNIRFLYSGLRIGNIELIRPRIVFSFQDVKGNQYESSRLLIQTVNPQGVIEIKAGDFLGCKLVNSLTRIISS